MYAYIYIHVCIYICIYTYKYTCVYIYEYHIYTYCRVRVFRTDWLQVTETWSGKQQFFSKSSKDSDGRDCITLVYMFVFM